MDLNGQPIQAQLPQGQAGAGVRLLVGGQVQGVGFRPFVYRLARHCRLTGQVRNASTGVVIELEGKEEDIAQFQERLLCECPAAARIDNLRAEESVPKGYAAFSIQPSEPGERPRVRIPRDLATCPACIGDIFGKGNRRREYPFTNCTACGPRYSILTGIPYDRPATTMHRFVMCGPCFTEYATPTDRRFHAQPNACPACGPRIALWDRAGRQVADADTAIGAAAEGLRRGQIMALKGLGGFQLLARADQSNVVVRLRQRKQRPSKPLAVMVSSLEDAEAIGRLGLAERTLLLSPENPIVLVDSQGNTPLAPEVAPRVRDVGLFLPTTPLHHLLLAEVGLPLVATSGNRAEEPIVTDEADAVRRLAGIADVFLVHDRPIVRGLDDSVVRVIAGRPVTLRLARGYAPMPIRTPEGWADGPPVLAVGGHQKSAVAIWTGAQAVLTQHVGDLDGPETRASFRALTRDLADLYKFEPAALTCDLHPDYFTTRWAGEQNHPVIPVQHHHAHAVACMAEHDLLDCEVLAFTWDGTGYGPDGTIWGGEVLRVRAAGFERIASLLPFPLPGGEAAIHRPARAAFGLLSMQLSEEVLVRSEWPRRLGLTLPQARALGSVVRQRTAMPWTSSVGRLFDAVAALVLNVQQVSYEGEAALWLEASADPLVMDAYPLPFASGRDDPLPRGDWRPMLQRIMHDLARDEDVGTIAARFHNALAAWASAVATRHPQKEVVLAGGCFQNRLLTERTVAALQQTGRGVYLCSQVPPGDGGLAVGQLAVAMAGLRQAGKD